MNLYQPSGLDHRNGEARHLLILKWWEWNLKINKYEKINSSSLYILVFRHLTSQAGERNEALVSVPMLFMFLLSHAQEGEAKEGRKGWVKDATISAKIFPWNNGRGKIVWFEHCYPSFLLFLFWGMHHRLYLYFKSVIKCALRCLPLKHVDALTTRKWVFTCPFCLCYLLVPSPSPAFDVQLKPDQSVKETCRQIQCLRKHPNIWLWISFCSLKLFSKIKWTPISQHKGNNGRNQMPHIKHLNVHNHVRDIAY